MLTFMQIFVGCGFVAFFGLIIWSVAFNNGNPPSWLGDGKPGTGSSSNPSAQDGTGWSMTGSTGCGGGSGGGDAGGGAGGDGG